MATETETEMAAAEAVETKTEPTFQRGRHLAFALVGLAHAPLTSLSSFAVFPLVHASAWTPQVATIDCLVHLCFAAFVAWLAFAVFDTHAGVTIMPARWTAIGASLAVWCVVQELGMALGVCRDPNAALVANPWWITSFTELGHLRFGWLFVAVLAAAAAEEIIYRSLLLRALEGFMSTTPALLLHALIFELVHAFFYGLGVTGIWFVGGLVLGYAFQRTRSLAVPTLLHAGHNFLFFTLVWYLNQ